MGVTVTDSNSTRTSVILSWKSFLSLLQDLLENKQSFTTFDEANAFLPKTNQAH